MTAKTALTHSIAGTQVHLKKWPLNWADRVSVSAEAAYEQAEKTR